MKPFSARTIMAEATAARDDVTRAAESVERAAKVGIVVFVIVGIVASLALVTAIGKGTNA